MKPCTASSPKIPLKRLTIYAYILACLLGVLFHFVYDWSGQSTLAGLFFPINESTWEHLKLVFFPILLVAPLEYGLGGIQNNCFFCIKLRSALLGMAAVIVLFYTYSGILGRLIDWINIAIYFIAMLIAYGYSYRKISAGNMSCNSTACIIGATVLIVLFMIFSVYPPGIGLFEMPPMAQS